ncbi:methyl-accepting chemotaxis protein [Roseobacter sinensis]|uniref:Methyl-accepting chemotaxis protein n=1 Tax=Roseobacter sinensis TaxID=2931391 RepID=A0ABT3BL85_9RHOB|nr:methyl-accepting chemotaxis protein [Roseobacter sp. WL0113]MCV3274339.1 methyl-accepting chemotaxis protein [Roseobacter sp. WL0113]
MSSPAPISKQIFSISGALIVSLVLLSAFAITITLLIKSTFVEYRSTARVTLEAGAILENTLEARMAALKWRLSPDAARIEEFRDNIEELRAAKTQVEAVGGDDSQLVRTFQNLAAELAEYEAQFNLMLDARMEYDTVESELTEAGLTARKALTEIMTTAYEDNDPTAAFYAGRAQEALMLGRYYLEKYRRTEAATDLERSVLEMRDATAELGTLRTELQNPRRLELADVASRQMTSFINRSGMLSEAVQKQVSARGVMDTLGPKIVADVETVINIATDRQNTLGPRGQAVSFWAVVAICVAAVMIVAFGWRYSNRLAARISGDLEDAVSAMSKIAAGDLETAVHHAEFDNEIGRMARALEVFKANGKAAIEAAEREKTAEAERQRASEALRQQQEAQEAAARNEAEAVRKAMIADLSASLGKVVNAASDGDFSQRVDADFGDEELSALATNMNKLVQNMDHGIDITGQALRRVAEGDLTELMEGEFKGAFKDLQDNTNGMIVSLKSLIGDISGSTVNLSSSSDELRDTSDALSKQAEQNAASLEETSAALEELTASIKQVSENVEDANSNASMARETAKSSSVVAEDAAEAMSRISGASGEIAKVVTVIDEISFQINLLALNAGVEAARTGEAGRGFSVVASEVRQLAQRAGEAAKEIDEVIARSDQAVAEGVEKVSNAKQSLEMISESVIGVSQLIDQISPAISEQVNGIAEINSAVGQIDSNTQKQAASFEEVTATSALLSDEAGNLKNSTARFKTGHEVMTLAEPSGSPKTETSPRTGVLPRVRTSNLAEDLSGWDEF